MIVNKVIIQLEGKYDLSRLEDLRFIKGDYTTLRNMGNECYFFDGRMHRYIFKPLDGKHVEVIITAKSKDIKLIHQITFGNFNDWVRKCVDTIQIGRDR